MSCVHGCWRDDRVQSRWKKCVSSLPIVGTFILEGGVYYCYIAGFYQLAEMSGGNITLHVLVSFFFLYALLLQVQCMLISPGNIKSGELEAVDTASHLTHLGDMVEEDYIAGKTTPCDKCNRLRPARAHHCSLCQTCVYRYDHHCPWIGNCIGLKNYRLFLLYLTSVTVCAGLIGVSCAVYAGRHEDYRKETLAGAVIGLATLAGVGSFTFAHYIFLSINRTTIEVRAHSRNIFNVGMVRNWVETCGPLWFLWLCPFPLHPQADGVRYPVVIGLKDGSVQRIDRKLLT